MTNNPKSWSSLIYWSLIFVHCQIITRIHACMWLYAQRKGLNFPLSFFSLAKSGYQLVCIRFIWSDLGLHPLLKHRNSDKNRVIMSRSPTPMSSGRHHLRCTMHIYVSDTSHHFPFCHSNAKTAFCHSCVPFPRSLVKLHTCSSLSFILSDSSKIPPNPLMPSCSSFIFHSR